MIAAVAYALYKDTDSIGAFNSCESFLMYDIKFADFFETGMQKAKKYFFPVEKTITDEERVKLLFAHKVDAIIAAYINEKTLDCINSFGLAGINGCLKKPDEAVEILLSGGNPGAPEHCSGSCGSCESGCESGS